MNHRTTQDKNQHRERGMTAISLAVVIAVVGFLGLMAINIIPHFINDSTIGSVFNGLKTNSQAKTASIPELKKLIINQFNINNIYHIESDQLQVKKDKRGTVISLAYEPRGTLIGQVDYIISFSHETVITK